jgi:hypothetical protein
MNRYLKDFADGFFGSFVLAAVILTAIPRAIHELVHSQHDQSHNINK